MNLHNEEDLPQDVAFNVKNVLFFLATAVENIADTGDEEKQGLASILLAAATSMQYIEGICIDVPKHKSRSLRAPQ